jgi:acetylserotonin N-methyltransferase
VTSFPPPPPDEKPLRDLIAGGLALPTVLAAHELGLFGLLAGGPRQLAEIAEGLALAPRPAETLLTLCTAVGLLSRRGDRFALSPLGERCFVPGADEDFGAYWDFMLAHEHLYVPSSIRAALREDAPQAGGPPGDRKAKAERMRAFTRAMHARGVPSARVWPDLVDLGSARMLLDLGGGSGVHAMAAVRRWPELRAIVLDRPVVCEVAAACIAEAGLADRISVEPADIRGDAILPPADVHFYSDVLHNASPEENLRLLRRSRRDLAPAGRVIIHEMLLDDDRSGPPAAAAAGVMMLLWTRTGQQHTARELHAQLDQAGFVSIRTLPAAGYYALVTATSAEPLPGAAPA